MKQEPLISVVMPVYNGGKYLREAIESILNQTCRDFEFLIINDGSKDKSDEIIRSYNDPRIKYFQNDGNKGLVYTLNFGIGKSQGKYIARMDADDISFPERFTQQIEAFRNDPKLGFCGTWAKVIGTLKPFRVESDPEKLRCKLLLKNQFVHSSLMFKRELLLEDWPPYKKDNFPAEDYALWIDLATKTKMTNIPKFLLGYREHASQISSESSKKQRLKTNELRLTLFKRLLGREPSILEIKSFIFFADSRSYVKNYNELEVILQQARILEDINKVSKTYNHQAFSESLQEYLEYRFLYQNYKNNTISFLFSFYRFYFKNKLTFKLSFHPIFIIKCLIFYRYRRHE